MSISALTLAMYHSQATYSTRLVLIAISNFDGEYGAYPSHETIGRLAGGLNRRTVQRAIDDLVELGELTEVRREGSTNLYRVSIACPDECDGTTNHRTKKGSGLQTAGGSQTAPGGGAQTAGGAVRRPPEPEITFTNNLNTEMAQFDEFYKVYPRRIDRGDAFKAFRSALKRASFEDILAGAIRFASDPNLPEKKFIKYPAKWLRADAWENQVESANDTVAKNKQDGFWGL